MIRFPESVCAKAYADLEQGQNCDIEQVSAVLGVPKRRLEEITDDSVKKRYTHRDETNPFYDIFARKLVNWRDETGGVTPATLIDIAKDLRVHARILDCTGRIFLGAQSGNAK